MTLDKERLNWEREAKAIPLPTGIVKTYEEIAGVSCVWVSKGTSKSKKIILYAHGGGLVAGSAITHQGFAAQLASTTGSSVLLVNYRRLPEHQYPAPLDDILLVYRALIDKNKTIPSNIVFGGDSSGGGLLIAALVSLRDSGDALPSGVFTVSGAFDMTLSSESMVANPIKDSHLSTESLREWRDTYLPHDVQSPLLSPLFADLSALPKTLLLAGGKDPWLSDSENLTNRINEYGGDVSFRVWDTMEHVWVLNADILQSQDPNRAIDEKPMELIQSFREAHQSLSVLGRMDQVLQLLYRSVHHE